MRVILSALLVCSLFGCSKKKEEGETKPATTETKPVEIDTSKPGPEAPPPAAAANGTPVDPCTFVSKDQVKALVGADIDEPEKMAAMGSMLGGCNWRKPDFSAMLSVQARPVGEFDATANVGKNKKEVPGVGEKAFMTDAGMFVKVAGKPYFLHVMAMGANAKQDEAKATELAKLAVAGAK
jgi:hypothetical protein